MVGGVGVGQALDVGVAAQSHRPILAQGRSHDVVFRREDEVHGEVSVALVQLFGGLEARDQGTARESPSTTNSIEEMELV